MELRIHDLLAASLRAVPGLGRDASGAGSWHRQLACAQENLRRGSLDSRAPFQSAVPERERASELESCGVPQAGPAPQQPAHAGANAAPAPVSSAEADTSASRTPVAEHAREHVPVRIHVDARDPQGTTVWLGVDCAHQRVSEQAANLVTGLRQALQATPERLAAVICNGATVYAAATPALARSQRPSGVPATASLKDLP